MTKNKDKKLNQNVKFIEAGVKLRQVFSDELVAFHPHIINQPDKNAFKILNRAFPAHMKVINKFKFYLDSKRKQKFETAWREYYGYDSKEENIPAITEKNKNGYSTYIPKLKGCVSQWNTHEEALKNIKEAASLYVENLNNEEISLIEAKSIMISPIETQPYA